MSKNFYSYIKSYYITIFILSIFICIFFIPFFENTPLPQTLTEQTGFIQSINTQNMCWPLPGYTRISSPFGYRNSPTAGASSFHGGIDLPAPPGTNIVSAISGKVVRTGFMGSGGCSVVVQNDRYTVIFHHVSPNYLVYPGEFISSGQIIAQVGPKNVYGFAENHYKDLNRKPYKWCNNWTTFAFYC